MRATVEGSIIRSHIGADGVREIDEFEFSAITLTREAAVPARCDRSAYGRVCVLLATHTGVHRAQDGEPFFVVDGDARVDTSALGPDVTLCRVYPPRRTAPVAPRRVEPL